MATDGEIKIITLPNNKSYDIVDDGAVRYDKAQSLTSEQKAQARSNIGAGTSSFSGNYNDLSNKPSIPTVNDGALTVVAGTTASGTFTANQSGNSTITIDAVTHSELNTAVAPLSGAMHFIGTSSSAITDGGTENPTISGYTGTAKTNGNVVIYSTQEFVWANNKWNLFGNPIGDFVLKTEATGYNDILTKTDAASTYATQSYAATVGPVASVAGKTGVVKLTKSDVGLSKVENFKAVSTVASQGLNSTEQANARANIGAGTSNFSGSYTDLSDKPTIPTLTDSTSTTSSTVAASATAVKAAYDHYPSAATTTTAGLMSAADKTKINNLRRIFYGTSTPSGAIAGDFWYEVN